MTELARKFQRRMLELQKQILPETYYEVIKAKIIDYITKHPDVDYNQLKKIIDQTADPKLTEFILSVFKKHNDTLDIVNELYEDLGIEIQRDFSKMQRIEKVNQLKLGKYKEETITEIKKTVRRGLSKKLKVDELTADLNKLGDEVSFYGKTIATTQIKAYARTAKNEKANIAEVFYYEYIGVIRKNTRSFCKNTLGETYHIDEINKFDAGAVGPAFISPCILYCGGWNCYHDWEPDPFYKN